MVGDWPDVQFLLHKALVDAHYEVACVRTCREAEEVLQVCPERKVVLICSRTGTRLLETAEHDPRIGRHAFVLEAEVADLLPPEERLLIMRQQLPVLAKPFDLDDVLAAVERAAVITRAAPAPVLATMHR
jgi:hypothetical protein